MDCTYQDWRDLEDELYKEDDEDPEGSEANSELEFHLYSQLHYSSNAGELEQHGDGDQEHAQEATNTTEGEQSNKDEPLSPLSDKIQLYLERVRRDKAEKKKKTRDSTPKDPKPCFEDVILIDSGPDVISISEESGDEEGICSLKGQSSDSWHTSTPALKPAKERFSEVTLSSSTSESTPEESDSESDSDSSESDVLENWMILGRGNQDGDQSISLNLDGSSHSTTGGDLVEEGSWMVSDKDKKAQICNKTTGPGAARPGRSNRYYTEKNVHCRNCNKNGHLSKNCPEPKKLLPCFLCGTPGHRVSDCPDKYCNNCGLPGHLFSFCSERAYWHMQCHRCSMKGHMMDTCPEIWRQYHITTKPIPPIKSKEANNGRSPAYCYNCSQKGHFGHVCNLKRMLNGVHPTVPFINYYDKMSDIESREVRIKFKAKDLKRNGYFLPLSKTSNEPSKKKRKIHHWSSHTPHQTPKGSLSHIFFNDDNEVSAAKQKKKKSKGKETVRGAKPWKPKRPVPTSRDQLPLSKHWNEGEDFPRGGGTGESMVKKKKKKKKKKNNSKHSSRTFPNGLQEGEADQCSSRGKGKGKVSAERKWRKKAASAERKLRRLTHPENDDLFTIKQRKRSR